MDGRRQRDQSGDQDQGLPRRSRGRPLCSRTTRVIDHGAGRQQCGHRRCCHPGRQHRDHREHDADRPRCARVRAERFAVEHHRRIRRRGRRCRPAASIARQGPCTSTMSPGSRAVTRNPRSALRRRHRQHGQPVPLGHSRETPWCLHMGARRYHDFGESGVSVDDIGLADVHNGSDGEALTLSEGHDGRFLATDREAVAGPQTAVGIGDPTRCGLGGDQGHSRALGQRGRTCPREPVRPRAP